MLCHVFYSEGLWYDEIEKRIAFEIGEESAGRNSSFEKLELGRNENHYIVYESSTLIKFAAFVEEKDDGFYKISITFKTN